MSSVLVLSPLSPLLLLSLSSAIENVISLIDASLITDYIPSFSLTKINFLLIPVFFILYI